MKRVWWNCCIGMDAAAKQFVEENAAGISTSVAFDIHTQIERQWATQAAAPDNLSAGNHDFTSGKKLAKAREQLR